MPKKSLKKAFVEYCLKEKFEKNREQIKILDILYSFHQKKNFYWIFLINRQTKWVFIYMEK